MQKYTYVAKANYSYTDFRIQLITQGI